MQQRQTKFRGPPPPYWFEDPRDLKQQYSEWGEPFRWHSWHYSGWVTVPRWTADLYFYVNLRRAGYSMVRSILYWFLARLLGWRRYRP